MIAAMERGFCRGVRMPLRAMRGRVTPVDYAMAVMLVVLAAAPAATLVGAMVGAETAAALAGAR